MGTIKITDFDLDKRPGHKVRVTATFRLTPSATERRLEIPFDVTLSLYEADRWRDFRDIYYSGGTESFALGGADDHAGLIYHGRHSGETVKTVHRTLDRDDLPGEVGIEEWYVLAKCIPDVSADTGVSEVFKMHLA